MDAKELFESLYVIGNTKITQGEVKDDETKKVTKPAFVANVKNVKVTLAGMIKAQINSLMIDACARKYRADIKSQVNNAFKVGGVNSVNKLIRELEEPDNNLVKLVETYGTRTIADPNEIAKGQITRYGDTPEDVNKALKEMGLNYKVSK